MPKVKFQHDPIFPNPLLCCIIGATNTGKTYLLFHILTSPEKLVDFNELVLYVPRASQMDPEYQFLKYGFENGLPPSLINSLYHVYQVSEDASPEDIRHICREAANPGRVQSTSENSEVIEKIPVTLSHTPNEEIFHNGLKTCVILDDVLGEANQTFQESLFQRGRHGNCCGFYLAQNFTKLDRNTVRENTTCYIIFKQKDTNLNHIARNIETNYEPAIFKAKCREAWKKKYGYIYINTRADEDEQDLYKDVLTKIPL
ncbi:hypothetical protein BOX15_Mlig016854g2 [Macrostomum lignano]|uniref:Uncharacterized protein n=1 Tax=Macrostomum lignano TaxID=282301 RepID=A0A267GTG6_9PLAT|nr:hypothetical protein BOX15_Mlig016854g2 [Macrostomum lignano]